MKYIETGQCIWCGKKEPEVSFENKPHILPHSLGGDEIGFDICDDCNAYFGTVTLGKPALDFVFKEIFNAYRFFSQNLTSESYKKFHSAFFNYYHKKHLIKIRSNFRTSIITRQFKRSLFYIFLQKYHFITRNGNHPMFDSVRKFARYGIGSLKVFYAFNNIILTPANKDHPTIPMTTNLIEDMMYSGLYPFWCIGHHFYIEVLPVAFNVNGSSYLQRQVKYVLIPAIGDEGIFEFNDIMAGTIATRRTDVTILWMSDDVKEWDETIHNTRHTLYPVCGDSIDHVIGILNAKDHFRLKEKSKDMVIDSVISAPYFVMETTKADVLFKNMKQSKQSMAIVLDEYGGVVGIVTLFDLLEEIVGDLNDIEPISSEEETVIIRISDNKWEVKGNIRLSDIEDAIGVTFTAEDCDTFTGFVFQKFGMVPKDGDTKIELEIENMHIIIDKIKEHQVEHAIIEILE